MVTRTPQLNSLDWIRKQAAAFREGAEEESLKGVLSKHFQTQPDKPFFLEDVQARAFGFDLPDEWQVKAFRDPTSGDINFRQVNNRGWEIIDEATLQSPTGEQFTWEDLQRLDPLAKQDTGLFTPVLPNVDFAGTGLESPRRQFADIDVLDPIVAAEVFEPFKIEELSPKGLPQYSITAAREAGIGETSLIDFFGEEAVNTAEIGPTGLVWDYQAGRYVPATFDLQVTRDFYKRTPELLPQGLEPTLTPEQFDTIIAEQDERMFQLNQAMQVIFPDFLTTTPEDQRSDLTAAYFNAVIDNPQIQEDFITTVLDTGRTADTETLLKTLNFSDANIDEFFTIDTTLEASQAVMRMEPEWRSVTGEVLTQSEKDKRFPLGTESELDLWALTPETARNYTGVLRIFGEGLTKLPKQLAAAILQATQGMNGASVVNRDWADEVIRGAQVDMQEFVENTLNTYSDIRLPIGVEDIANLPTNMAFSLTSMGAGLGTGVPIGLLPVPGARIAAWGAGTLASGAVAYNMTTYQIMQQYLEVKDAEMQEAAGRGLTQVEEDALKKDFSRLASQYGLWEAVPEAVSNLAFARIITAPLSKIVGRHIATQVISKVTAMYGQELLTETITQKGQSGIEVEAGLREGSISWIEAFKEIAPQTFLLTTVLGGIGSISVSSLNRIKESLKKEAIKKDLRTSLIDEIAKNIDENIFSQVEPAETPLTAEAEPPSLSRLSPNRWYRPLKLNCP